VEEEDKKKNVAVESKTVAVEPKPADSPFAVDPQKSATSLEPLLASFSIDKTMATTPPRSSAPAGSVSSFLSPSVAATSRIFIGGNASEFPDGTKVSQCAAYFFH
jgi:hypothetical protein